MFSLLYVDDEPGLLEIGRLYLEKTGEFTVTCAESGKKALEHLSEKHFDAIVSDYQMPGMDGIELLKTVRASYGKIPFIIFTGRGREEIVIAAINNGADFYLQKGGEPKTLFAELAHKLRQSIGKREAEKELSDSKKRLADIINFLPDATLAIDSDGVVIAWNQAMEEMTGTAAADILGKGNYEYACTFYGSRRKMLIDLVFAPDESFEKDHYQYTLRTSKTLTAETIFERPGRPAVHLWGKASRLYDDNGAIIGAIESIRDITDIKQNETDLRAANEELTASAEELRSQYEELAESKQRTQESEEKYRTLVEHSQDGIFIAQAGHLAFHNRGFREILGYAEGELDGISLDRCIAPEDRDLVLARHYSRLSGDRLPEMYECSFLGRDNTKRRVKMDVGLATYQGKPATIGTIHDVTQERLREEKLRESEEKYRTLVENLQDVVYRTDREGRLIMLSPSGAALIGSDSLKDLIGKPVADTFYPAPEKRQKFLDALSKEGTVKNFETELRKKDGTPVLVSTSSHYYYDRDGTVLGVEGVLHDITVIKQKEKELKKAYEQISTAEEELRQQYGELEQSEKKIRESETRLRYMLEFYEHSQESERELFMAAVEGAGVVTSSPIGYLALVSDDESELRMYAWSKNAMAECAMPDKPLVYKTEKTGLWGEAIRQRRAVITNDYAAPGPGKKGLPPGHPPIVRHMNVPVIEDGHIVLVAGVANKPEEYTDLDVRELRLLMQGLWQVIKQKRAEAALREERMFSDAVLDSVPGLLYLYDESGLLIRWNRQHEVATGYSREELAGMHLMDWYRGNEKATALIGERVGVALRDGYADAEAELTTKDGRKVCYYFTAVRVDIRGRKYFTGVGIDITARKKAEAELIRRRQQLEEITATVPGVVYQFYARPDGSRGISYVSGRTQEVLGVEGEAGEFFAWITEHIHDDDRARFVESVETALADRQKWQFEGRFVKPSGETIWFQAIANLVPHENVLIYTGFIMDITDRIKAGEALRASETKYRTLVENSHDVIYTISPEGIITFVSPGWTAALGHPVSEVVGKSLRDFIHPLDLPRCEAVLAEVVRTGKRQTSTVYRVFHADGSIRYNSSNISPIFDEKGTVVSCIGTAQDVTDMRQSEIALRETNRKLNLLNTITRHDVANQIMIVQAYSEMAKLKKPGPSIVEMLAGIDTAANVIARQIDFMRMYQDLGVKAPSWHAIDEIAISARHPDLSLSSTCGPVEIYADPMIGRVFFNLYDNAVRHGERATQVTVGCEMRGDDVVITVQDNGIGVLPDEKERIFEKGYGKHTGFGLFLSREILAITGISIRETGTYGSGARFEITVPNGAYRSPCGK
ncbi:MAG: PAS domain S-box protein [Methanoregula sp.]|nr:PAS domain S-box protein [Methanoregula sp.]